MTESREGMPRGYNMRRVQKVETILDRLRRENAKRRKCPHCVLMIMPATLAHHIKVCHDD
jgi:hypothetical protein